MKSTIGIILLALGVATLCIGTYITSGGKPSGWAAIIAGGAGCSTAYVLMRPTKTKDAEEDRA